MQAALSVRCEFILCVDTWDIMNCSCCGTVLMPELTELPVQLGLKERISGKINKYVIGKCLLIYVFTEIIHIYVYVCICIYTNNMKNLTLF